LPGSDGLYSARLSPDGRYVAAFQSDASRLMLYDFNARTWSELAQGNLLGFNNWSHDGKFVYMVHVLDGQRTEVDRVRVADRKLERFTTPKDISPGAETGWLSLGSDDSPILQRDKSTQEIYALNLELP
jgi:hypothetical protein